MPLVPHASHGRRGVLSHSFDARHEVFGQQHVVVSQEHRVGADLGAPHELNPSLDQRLAGDVRRMRLARHDQLHWALRVRQQAQQPLGIVQQQVRSLVRCEAARETQRQRYSD